MKRKHRLLSFLKQKDTLDAFLKEKGLNWTDLRVLILISDSIHYDYPVCRTADLVEWLGMDEGWVFRSVKKLLDRNIITKSDSGMLSENDKAIIMLSDLENYYLRDVA